MDAGATAFAAVGAETEVVKAESPEELVAAADGANALLVDAGTQVTERVLSELDSLKVVGRSGIGVDNVDVDAARERGVTVVNVPDYCLDEVSSHALGMLLSCARRLPALDRSVREGEWDWSVGGPIRRVRGSTVGLVGFGKIARSLAAKLRGFDVDVLVYDPHVSEGDLAGFSVTRTGFDRLLTESDFVSVHAPLTDETHGMFDADAFGTMPDHAIFVNTARGPIVDEGALCDALASDGLAGAGLDVRESEPPTDDRVFEFDNVVCSPHAAFYSEESRRELSRSVSEDVCRVLRGEKPRNPVETGDGWG
ncbi:D-3-phosphoglycerate dehydrogenase [Halogeometricum pallidum JCM 14848]|uniref:D-3-phosphoglycerate dehydrogenase n=1 Tax=Halogeometricum pallidum JCM 14848 TaxID=1227487 RepID=M0CZY0_HALPD|nr:D-3-phosphoglycerate dehydrogenase [Halogeometricum pallidum JCM 14848]